MIRAALLCVSLASELPGAGERQNSLPFQKPLHPMNRFAHKHAKGEKTEVATKERKVMTIELFARRVT
jgi:hypothetical protein